MKRLFNKSVLLLAIIALPSQAESFSAKRAGQGFTSITQDFTSSLSNPALLTSYDDDDDLFFSLNVGVLGSDEYGVIDTGELIADQLEVFEDDINSLPFPPTDADEERLLNQVDEIIVNLEELDNKIITAREGVNFQVIIPNRFISLGMFANQYGRIGAIVDYSEQDEQTLTDAIDDALSDPLAPPFDVETLESNATGLGYSVSEVGFMLGTKLASHVNYDLSIGTKIKYQRLDLYYNQIFVADFNDDDNDFDIGDDEFITDSTGTNIDLGLYVAWGEERQWHAALVANNLMSQEVTFEEQDITYELNMSAILGLSYKNDWLTLSTEFDLTDREDFQQLAPSKYLAVGAEFKIAEHMQFRLGAKQDLNDNEPDLVTLGLGLSPGDVISFDIAAFAGENDTAGVALEIGLKI